MGSWAIVPAIQRQGLSSQGANDAVSNASKMGKMGQPSYTDKQIDKKEESNMLPMQKQFYIGKQLELQQRNHALDSEMYDYFYKNRGVPPAGMQQKWNKEMYSLKQEESALESYGSTYKQNFAMQKEMFDKLLTGEKSTANRIALEDVNGRLLPIIGRKDEGVGWLTHMEQAKGFDMLPGINSSGMPAHALPSTAINYTGDFQKLVDDRFSKIKDQKIIEPIRDDKGNITGYQQAVDIVGDDELKYMSIISTSGNVAAVTDAAEKMISMVTGNAKLDLASDFYEKLLFAQSDKDGGIHMVLDPDGKMVKSFDPETSKSLTKLLSMKELTQVDVSIIDHAMKEYGKYQIMNQVPSNVKVDQVIRDIKTSETGGKDNIGPLTAIAAGKTLPEGPAQTISKSDGLYAEGLQGSTQGGKQSILLGRYPTLGVEFTSGFNTKAVTALKDEGGIQPEIMNPNGFFYNEQGYPNSMSLLTGVGASIVGITGRVQQQFYPDTKQTAKGYEYDVPDAKKTHVDNLIRNAVKSIEVTIAVPDNGDGKSVLKSIKGLEELEIKEGITGEVRDQEYYMTDSAGKRNHSYKLFHAWFPVTDEQLAMYEDPKYNKYTQKFIADKAKTQLENEKTVFQHMMSKY